ncbi:MAG: S49 family peptidase [Bacteroidales bacterium]|nr:S49 family peptidase [Bacteroidales bacterium]
MNPFLFDILSSNWLLHAENPDAYGAMLVSLLRGDRISADDFSKARELNRPFVLNFDHGIQSAAQPLNSDSLSKGSVAVIPVRGIIMKDDVECGPRGSVSITRDIKSADSNPNIKSILLVVSSPGGTTSYTDILSDSVKNCSKPVVAFVEGMAASAAYWIISGADKIICSSDLDTIGSIGTMLEYMDMKPYFEKAGVVIHEVYATLSTEKNQYLSDLRSGNYDPLRKNLLDRINSKFHASVTANRPSLDVSTLTGKTYFASDAISLGLVDEIGSYEYALEQANSFPAANSNNIPINSNNPDMKIKMLTTWAAIAAFFNFTGNIESNELTEEMVGQLNDKLADQNTQITDLTLEVATVTEKFDTLQSVHAETVRQHEALKAEDAAAETRRGKTADKSAETIASDQYLHNKIADENI